MAYLNRRSRRSVLKTTAGIAGLTKASGVVGASSRSTRVTVVRGGTQDRSLVTSSVPRRWYSHEQTIEQTLQQVGKRLLSHDYVESVSLGSSNQHIEGHSLSQIQVEIPADAPTGAESTIPDSIQEAGADPGNSIRNTKIVTERVQTNHELGGCKATQSPRPFHGGVGIQTDSSDGPFQEGTAGFRVYHAGDGQHYMVTANHVVAQGRDCSGGKGLEVRDWSGDTLGYGGENNVEHDWILVSEKDTYSDKIVTSGSGTTQTVNGYMTDDGIKTAQSRNRLIESFGNVTGNTAGYITERGKYTNAGCVFFNFSGVKIDLDFAKGDSGGPIWADWDGCTSVIGVNSVLNVTDTYTDCLGNDYGLSSYLITYGVWRVVNNNPYRIGNGIKNP